MLYRHVFDTIFTKFRGIFRVFCKFRGISRIYLIFAAPRPGKISEALDILQCSGLLIIRGKKVKFRGNRGIFGNKIAEKSVDFTGIFRANLARKQSVEKRWILWLSSGQILQEIDWFCTD